MVTTRSRRTNETKNPVGAARRRIDSDDYDAKAVDLDEDYVVDDESSSSDDQDESFLPSTTTATTTTTPRKRSKQSNGAAATASVVTPSPRRKPTAKRPIVDTRSFAAETGSPPRKRKSGTAAAASPPKHCNSTLSTATTMTTSSSTTTTTTTTTTGSNTTTYSSRSIAVRGIPRGALAKDPTSGWIIRVLASLDPLDNHDSDDDFLPCPFLVVATHDDDDDESSLPLLVGSQFENGRVLQKACHLRGMVQPKLPAITYEMQVIADPPFAPWKFVQDRLLSANLTSNHQNNANGEDTTQGPFVITIDWDGNTHIASRVSWYQDMVKGSTNNVNLYEWALIESEQKELPAVIVGAAKALVAESVGAVAAGSGLDQLVVNEEAATSRWDGNDFLPPLSTKICKVALPASLLQKAIRRGSMLCSPQPLLDACAKLLLPSENPMPGSTLAMLKTVWGCMLVDASPFDDCDTCLGLPAVLTLSLIARADSSWTLPPTLRRAAVCSALRTASIVDTQPWIGFVRRNDDWWKLEEEEEESTNNSTPNANAKALHLRNLIRVCQTGVGGRVAWGKWNKFIGDSSVAAALAYLNTEEWRGSHLLPNPGCLDDQSAIVEAWERGEAANTKIDSRIKQLDNECRLASIEPSISPYSLVLLQALLPQPPTCWKKHSLPSLARQVRKLISDANPRIRERIQLARLATWGKDKSNEAARSLEHVEKLKTRSTTETEYRSYKEIVTPTGTLSEKEHEIIECFEAIQKLACDSDETQHSMEHEKQNEVSLSGTTKPQRITAGPPLTLYQGRIAFLLAFSAAVELDVVPDPERPSEKETISAMFCGDPQEPLLVQRIGKARREGKELATTGGATSGAAAVPSLGYVQKERSVEEQRIMEAAQVAVADHWKNGITSSLPLLPPGMQWELPEDEDNGITRNAELVCDGKGGMSWQFSIAGVRVEAFDARPVVSACALDLDDPNFNPVSLDSVPDRQSALFTALYSSESLLGSSSGNALNTMMHLHKLAETDREKDSGSLSEGTVYDWLPFATSCPIPSRTWRDVLLAIRTREKDHVVIGRGINADGSGAPRDMTEGVILRLFYALEMLYPTALRKEGAMKFRVRPKGAAYYHLLLCLEKLGSGENRAAKKDRPQDLKLEQPIPTEQPSSKRTRRAAAVSARRQIASESSGDTDAADDDNYQDGANESDTDVLSVPTITTPLWPHQEASVSKVVEGVQKGKRGHADASAVGAGKTLTALATIVRTAQWMEATGQTRHGVLCMLPTKALIREWLLELATHTKGFHIIEQREDGSLFSLTYAKSHPPIDANAIVISTLDRVCRHPFVRQSSWDIVIVDECLSVQNSDAKRTPSAWRQIEISKCGVLMLSATFFRSKYDQLFYMIRMLRSPLPPSLPWLPATIHEHIVCQVPETDRSWTMKGELVSLAPKDFEKYTKIVEAFKRKQINESGEADGRKLWVDLESFLRTAYEGRTSKSTYKQTSVMSDAFSRVAKSLLRKGRKPLIFADTSQEAEFLLRTLQANGLEACTWATVTSNERLSGKPRSDPSHPRRVIVAVKTVEGQGINMQRHADTIICRPTPGDFLEQMKGRVDRPGQTTKDLLLVVIVAEHTVEEAKFANIRLAGNFFREYIAPVAARYRERIDLEAVISVAGTKKPKRGTVSGTWMKSVEAAGQAGTFSTCDNETSATGVSVDSDEDDESLSDKKPASRKRKKGASQNLKHRALNKVIRNKGDPQAVRHAKALAKQGHASLAVRNWLFPPKVKSANGNASDTKRQGGPKPLPKESLLRFSDTTPPLVLDRETVHKAVTHLSKQDPKMAALIARVGVDALVNDCGTPRVPSQALLFDRCIRAITFTMVSVDAGNSFMRRLAIKVGVCLERKPKTSRAKLLKQMYKDVTESGNKDHIRDHDDLLELLLKGEHQSLSFSPSMLRALIDDCEPTGHPHLCGPSHPCGKNDDHALFLEMARQSYDDGDEAASSPVSAGYSMPKASFLISLVQDFDSGKISASKIAQASDREAARMLIGLKGIGDWCAGGVLMHFLGRADIMLYGDLTIRNYLNDLYDISHHEESETLLESAADFADNATSRNLIDAVAKERGWEPYRSVICFLCYHLQEENLVLL